VQPLAWTWVASCGLKQKLSSLSLISRSAAEPSRWLHLPFGVTSLQKSKWPISSAKATL
jgi:hypothetical protein